MKLKYLLTVYIIFTVCYILRQIWETKKQEREFIDNGGSPLGDSTFIIYLVNLLCRTLISVILILALGNHEIPVANYWLFVLILIVGFTVMEVVCATIEALLMFPITWSEEKKYKKRMDKRADELNEQVNEKRNSDS